MFQIINTFKSLDKKHMANKNENGYITENMLFDVDIRLYHGLYKQ